ncbi:hypothetical protein L0F63_000668 [Massospora cicadina]|nr:hypothetical protein L0F63_000668 [Massospora cicadina]
MITSISPCPQDFRLVFTGHTVGSSINTGVAHGATLWQISEDLTQAFASTSPAALIKVVSFPGDSKILKNILLGRGSDMLICDVRSPSVSVIDSSHVGGILSVDGNPHLPYRFVSGGCDGMVKFWDHRQPKGPLQQMSHHTHWVWDVAFNPQYDQLLVTAGSDCLVNLESVGSLSSLSELGADSSRNDKLIGSFSHEESVYNVAWSPSNPWLFSSISFDGQLMFHSVPDNEKYDILL